MRPTHHPVPRFPHRPGFTLVEMLVVIVIIGILAAILVAAVGAAQVRAIDARIIAEINQLDAAVKSLKESWGSIPPSKPVGVPNAANQAAFMANLRRSFPKSTLVANNPTYAGFRTAFTTGTTVTVNAANPGYPGGGLDLNTMGPEEALVFWLGGLPAQHTSAGFAGSSKLTGFALDPALPFTPLVSPFNKASRSKVLFGFDESRLADVDNDGWLEYYPASGQVPYVYFDFRTYGSVTYSLTLPVNPNTALPYRAHKTGAIGSAPWVNPDSFQIICAGQDNVYGTNSLDRGYPSALNFDTQLQDHDNLTNFSTSRLENSL